ncbi:hypothetical protein RMATCC62417_17200 [Rhizopus microsporus]|nr:hypothetical protein RMATCC62417_17200 [Rhizopus microsporus]
MVVPLQAKRKFTEKFLDNEIESLREKVREAYRILAKKDMGHIPTEEENQVVEEYAVNKKLIARLEAIKEDAVGYKPKRFYKEQDFFSTLQFFYLVRLAQQGYFGIISEKYPALEPLAVRYLCDKLITASLYAVGSDEKLKSANSQIIFDIITALTRERDEPVGPGFKTTFKYISSAIKDLIKQTGLQHQPLPTTEIQSKPMDHSPQVWIMMPYTSMIDTAHLYPFITPNVVSGGFMGPTPFTTTNTSSSTEPTAPKNKSQDKPQPEEVSTATTNLESGQDSKQENLQTNLQENDEKNIQTEKQQSGEKGIQVEKLEKQVLSPILNTSKSLAPQATNGIFTSLTSPRQEKKFTFDNLDQFADAEDASNVASFIESKQTSEPKEQKQSADKQDKQKDDQEANMKQNQKQEANTQPEKQIEQDTKIQIEAPQDNKQNESNISQLNGKTKQTKVQTEQVEDQTKETKENGKTNGIHEVVKEEIEPSGWDDVSVNTKEQDESWRNISWENAEEQTDNKDKKEDTDNSTDKNVNWNANEWAEDYGVKSQEAEGTKKEGRGERERSGQWKRGKRDQKHGRPWKQGSNNGSKQKDGESNDDKATANWQSFAKSHSPQGSLQDSPRRGRNSFNKGREGRRSSH